jgi:hypothetical protein
MTAPKSVIVFPPLSQASRSHQHSRLVSLPYAKAHTNSPQIDLNRNRVSLGIRCRWGIRNALFHVAKEAGADDVLGIAMWMPPRPTDKPVTWGEWLHDSVEGWRLWGNQVLMNLWYGRGGLNVKVS